MSNSSETLYFNTMWTWHTDTGLPDGQYSKHIYLGETRVVTKQTSKLEASYGQSDEWHHQYYYHPDHLGSAQLITDYEGNEYQRIEYTPYGELWVEKKTANEKDMRYLPYKFTAKEQDEETGLYYYGARYLDAKYSRWLSADPAVGEYIPQIDADISKLPAGGVYDFINLNLYHYAGNNPIKYIDPDGNFKRKQFVFAAIQTVAGAAEVFATCAVAVGTGGLSAGLTIYGTLDGLANIGDGIIGMVNATKDKDYRGYVAEVTTMLAQGAGANEEQAELIGDIVSVGKAVVDMDLVKLPSIAKGLSSGTKLLKAIDNIISNASRVTTYENVIETSAEIINTQKKSNSEE